MSYPRASSGPYPYRDHPTGLASLIQRTLDHLSFHRRVSFDRARGSIYGPSLLSRLLELARPLSSPRALLNIPNALVLLWIWMLWWGERTTFRLSMDSCRWENWERWVKNPPCHGRLPLLANLCHLKPSGTSPHHLILLADPQLVDPHTYPGRPWPITSLTVGLTDLYLRRSYSTLQRSLHPDTIFFLGDLFDGGREWNTGHSVIKDPKWKRYGEDFWLREYDRFGRIFYDHWGDGGTQVGPGQRGRKLITSLPGNHDLGLGMGIQTSIRDRYNTYFGEGNRVDVIANHTFVSVDTVSLSAKDQPDPDTGAQGSGLGDGPSHGRGDAIWRPVQEFLDDLPAMKRRAIERELRWQNGEPLVARQRHEIITCNRFKQRDTLSAEELPSPGVTPNLPMILFTHVPLYRQPGTPCGPLRERFPPSPHISRSDNPPASLLVKDERNAILVQRGDQYQNVLTPEVSKELVEKISAVDQRAGEEGGEGNSETGIVGVFSGDDHDYCEVVHRGYTGSGGGIREITVKSMSMAMGVRKPGFLMVSLWNPLDSDGKPLHRPSSRSKLKSSNGREGFDTEHPYNPHHPEKEEDHSTIQTHLCLQPDQLSTYFSYAWLFGFTVFFLLAYHILISLGYVQPSWAGHQHPSSSPTEDGKYLLPTTEKRRLSSSPAPPPYQAPTSSDSSATSAHQQTGKLASRIVSADARGRSGSPSMGYGLPPAADATPVPSPWPHAQSNYQPPAVTDDDTYPYFPTASIPNVAAKARSLVQQPGAGKALRRRGGLMGLLRKVGRDMWWVGRWGVLWFLWLAWRG